MLAAGGTAHPVCVRLGHHGEPLLTNYFLGKVPTNVLNFGLGDFSGNKNCTGIPPKSQRMVMTGDKFS